MSDIASYRKKSGYPLLDEYTSPILVQQYSTISLLLQGHNINSVNDLFNASFDPRYCNEYTLALIVYKIQIFMEDQLGRNSSSENKLKLTKLPIQLFRNYSPYSSLHVILKISIDFQILKGWKEFDINTIDRVNDGFTLLKDLETKLVEYDMLRRPKIFFNKVPSNIEQTLRNIVSNHSGSIVDAANLASHVLDWDDEVDNLPAELSEEFIRTIDFRPELDGGIALVHWWYYPDCYDEWIPAQDVKDNDPPDINPLMEKDKKWRVCCRFVYDCQKFNEWGNEIDYLLDSDDEIYDEDDHENTPVKGATRGKRGRKRKDAVEATPKSKKQVIIPESIISTEKMMRYSQAPTLQNKRNNLAFVDIASGVPCEYVVIRNSNAPNSNANQIVESKVLEEDQAPVVDVDYDKKKARRAKKAAAILQQTDLPEWFDNDVISDFEKTYLSLHLFKGLSGALLVEKEKEYLRTRNFIIVLYAQNPTAFLSASDCRHKISGNVCDIVSIHEFLNAFGAINFLIRPELRPVGRLNFSTAQLKFNLLDDLTSCSGNTISQSIYKVLHKHDNISSKTNEQELDQTRQNVKNFLQVPHSLKKKESVDEINVPAFYYSMSNGCVSDKMKTLGYIIKSKQSELEFNEEIYQTLNILEKPPTQIKNEVTSDRMTEEMIYLEKKLELLTDIEKSLDSEKLRIGHDKTDISLKRNLKTFQNHLKLTFL